jgi:nucleoside-triphosphatase THEP1
MALRAILVVVAFSAISIELRNPRIVHWFLRRGLSPLSSALDVAFQALPAMMHAIGEERSFYRHPLRSTSRAIAVARAWLSRFEQEGPSVIAVITGEQGTGKTSFAESLAELVVAKGGTVAGILAPAVIESGERAGYRIRNLATGSELELCRRVSDPEHADVGHFAFHADGVAFGQEALRIGDEGYPDLVLLDEVGPLELAGKGWAEALTRLRKTPVSALVLLIRPSLLQEVAGRWNFTPGAVWKAETGSPAAAALWLLQRIPRKNP